MQVINEKGWRETTDDKMLLDIETIPLGERHVPVNHGEVLNMFREELNSREVNIQRESGLLSDDNLKYVYTVEVTDDATDSSYCFTLGFVNYNNKQKSFTMLAGEKVFVCSNEMYVGELNTTRRRHTTNIMFDLDYKLQEGFERYEHFTDVRCREIDVMREQNVSEELFGKIIVDMHRNNVMSNTNIGKLVEEWDEPTFEYEGGQSTMWDFQNCATHVAKRISNPLQRIETTSKLQEQIQNIII